jgi:WbqC-like protein family
MRVVISQSMLFPWVGMLEQVRLADAFVHYDDVQFSKGSFVNRVQVKTAQGVRWMTIPTRNLYLGQRIDEVELAPSAQWVDRHLSLLQSGFAGAPYSRDAMALAEGVYASDHRHLGALARHSLLALCDYFGLRDSRDFIDIVDLDIAGSGSERVLDAVKRVGGREYITGHGAARYLDHARFDDAGISVRYMKYQCTPYPQMHGAFTPHVTGLDLVANCGHDGRALLTSQSIPWREFLHEPA